MRTATVDSFLSAVAWLDQVFHRLRQPATGVNCRAIDSLIKEADQVGGDVADKEVLDAAIVGAAQSVEHYEIARYGTVIAWAEAFFESLGSGWVALSIVRAFLP